MDPFDLSPCQQLKGYVWWEVQEEKNWGPLFGFSATYSTTHISFPVGLED